MRASDMLARLHHELGAIGLAALALVLCGVAFLVVVLRPLEIRNHELERQIASNADRNATANAARAQISKPSTKLAMFYDFLATGRQPTEWLDQLYAAGRSTGIEMQSAEYRMHSTGTRVDRYEIRLPLKGNYADIRTFLDKALAEVPVLSLDEVKFRRERASDHQVDAELRLSLHLIHP